jgi:hypothetical protein
VEINGQQSIDKNIKTDTRLKGYYFNRNSSKEGNMSDNVLILGAGFSADAGIPLISTFIDRMFDYEKRGKIDGKPIDPRQKEILTRALEIKDELDGYHGRATFDDRNIEDILSILAFNVLGGGEGEQEKLNAMEKAIATTIELSCTTKHPGLGSNNSNSINISGKDIYRNFWKELFAWVEKGNKLPIIITLNYDLVLERSLFQTLIGTYFRTANRRLPFPGININYFYDKVPRVWYKGQYATFGDPFDQDRQGIVLEIVDQSKALGSYCDINILKLHGSLNFPKDEKCSTILTSNVDNPYILPPISNKLSSKEGDFIWKAALNFLRDAKNVIFIGYSLPKTDSYMQYFLKAGLGPNKNLNKVFVFNPAIVRDGDERMKERYISCFAENFRSRIIFHNTQALGPSGHGTLLDFEHTLNESPSELFF